ncbi:DUF7167 family protein [Marinobacter salarius]|uniref:DUF7167 domain-containing protein n=1 Tax=Marinobacter salarius TaxID=1420917 RepID=A0A1W6KFH8_9GAMM|nr:hypothetical protein [Marinobacter salarius]ARM86176.1 hypothetical protein MARSALSMR5_04156 [Marinobacter salarius]
MPDTIKVSYYVETDKIGSRCDGIVEFDQNHWNSMTAEEKETEMKEEAFNYVDWGFSEEPTDQDSEDDQEDQ